MSDGKSGRQLFALCALSLCLAACDDGEDDNGGSLDAGSSLDGAALTSSADAGDAAVPTQPPAYLGATRVFAPDGPATTYVQVLRSIEAGTTVELAKAHEFSGAVELFSLPQLGWFAIGGGEAPTIARYTVGGDDELTKQETINLQPYGVQDLFANKLYFVSPNKVYYPDPDGKQLVIINPSAMTVSGAIPLPPTGREGYTAVYSYDYVRRDGRILFSVGWFDWTNDKILPETGLVVLDTNTDTVVRVDVDTRCGGITQPVTLGSGDTYFASSALAGAAHRIGRLSLEPCALRILSSADAFDPNYMLRLRELTAGAIAGEPVPAGGDEIFLRVFDEGLATIAPETASWEVTGQVV